MVYHIFQKLKDTLDLGMERSKTSFSSLLLICGGSISPVNWAILADSGLVYKRDGMCHLVYDWNINFHHICPVVESSYEVLSKYSLGGATEIRFSNDCQSGTIEAKCFGSCYTVTGTIRKQSVLHITCSDYWQQSNIGEAVTVANGPMCCLIKLALNHLAIDFMILENRGGGGGGGRCPSAISCAGICSAVSK